MLMTHLRMYTNVNLLVFILVSIDITSSYSQDNKKNEMALRDGSSIEVFYDEERLIISSQSKLDRTYQWDECSLSTKLKPRWERWFGSLGAYNPAASSGKFSYVCNGIARAVAQEGQIHFDNEEFAREWVRRRPEIYMTVWADNGLLVSWGFSRLRHQLSIDVWLMCLNGKPYQPPSKPPGTMTTAAPGPDARALHNCAEVTQEDIDQTRSQIEKFWAQVDTIHAEQEKRKKSQ